MQPQLNVIRWPEYANSWLPYGSKIAVVQYSASSPVKSPPLSFVREVVRHLSSDFYNVYITDTRAQEKEIDAMITGTANVVVRNFATISRDVSDFAFLISAADLVIAPDSAAVHLAGCYNIPCVGIFSPFPPKESTGMIYDSVKPVFVRDGCKYRNAKTGGCYTYGLDPCKAAQEQGKNYSPCWDNLDVQDVVDAYRSITLDKK